MIHGSMNVKFVVSVFLGSMWSSFGFAIQYVVQMINEWKID